MTVVNIRNGAGFDVYIGRRAHRARDPRCHLQSVWHNPYTRRECGTAAAAVAKFEWLMLNRLKCGGVAYGVGPTGPANELWSAAQWRANLLTLHGKRLGCWCAPAECHGDVLVKLIAACVHHAGVS